MRPDIKRGETRKVEVGELLSGGETGPAKHKKMRESRYTRPGGARNGLVIGGGNGRAGAIKDGVIGSGGAFERGSVFSCCVCPSLLFCPS